MELPGIIAVDELGVAAVGGIAGAVTGMFGVAADGGVVVAPGAAGAALPAAALAFELLLIGISGADPVDAPADVGAMDVAGCDGEA